MVKKKEKVSAKKPAPKVPKKAILTKTRFVYRVLSLTHNVELGTFAYLESAQSAIIDNMVTQEEHADWCAQMGVEAAPMPMTWAIVKLRNVEPGTVADGWA